MGKEGSFYAKRRFYKLKVLTNTLNLTFILKRGFNRNEEFSHSRVPCKGENH